MVFFETLVKWSEASTIHGVVYAIEPKRNIFLRLLWLSILCAAAILTTWMTLGILNEWKDNPVVTTIKTTAYPINKLDFPAITICNQGFNIKTMYKFHKLMPDKWEPWFNRYVVRKLGHYLGMPSPGSKVAVRKFCCMTGISV